MNSPVRIFSIFSLLQVDEKLVRADSRIVLSHESNRKACVYVSISMKYEVRINTGSLVIDHQFFVI